MRTQSTPSEIVCSPVVAGSFYLRSRDVLFAQVQDFIDNADLKTAEGELIGLIVPHADYD